MEKGPKRPAGGLEGENTSGFLSGFLAEENQFDRRALWRLGSWGLVAVGAVTIAVMSNQSSMALRRDQVAATDLARQAQQFQSATKESQNETRRLASAVDTLNSDRDRLYTRITVLEQGLDSVTGAIARQNSGASPVQATPVPAASTSAAPDPQAWLKNLTPAPASAAAPVLSPVATAAATTADKPNEGKAPKAVDKLNTDPHPFTQNPLPAAAPAPVMSPVVTAAVKTADKPNAETKAGAKATDKSNTEAKPVAKEADKPNTQAKAAEKTSTDAAAAEKGPVAVSSLAPPASNAAAAPPASPAPLMPAKSMMAPPDPAAGRLIEPTRPTTPEADAFAPIDRAEAEASEGETANVAAIQRTEFGVDVGGANSIAGLRALWRGLVKTRSNAALTALRPIIVIKEGSNGLGMQLRLVAGPLNDAAAAAKICAGMTENNRSCETTVFEGQRLSIKAEDDAKSPAVKPVARKRSPPKQAVIEEQPKQPDPPSTLSALFGKH
jgi:hypothetical protein